MTFDVEISNQKQSQLAHGAMQIYFLRDNPQREPKEFARAFNLLGFSGLMIEVKENHSRIPVGVSIHSESLFRPSRRECTTSKECLRTAKATP